jgi:type I restriction enzyme R subunit
MDFAQSLFQNNQEFYGFIRDGIPVEWRAGSGETRHAHARAIDFGNGQGAEGKPNNRFRTARDLLLPSLMSGVVSV